MDECVVTMLHHGRTGTECTSILGAAIGYIMESIDMVLIGVESVVKSGGIINLVGVLGIYDRIGCM